MVLPEVREEFLFPPLHVSELTLEASGGKFKERDSECVQIRVFTTLFLRGPEHV